MGETNNAQKAGWFTTWCKGVKAEFKKIVWPDQKSLTKQTIAVVSVSVVLALIIKILDMVMTGRYGNNSLFLSMKYKNKSISDVPFVEKMDVSVMDPHTIKIEVYEKALAGYVEYLENYMYFDKDGIVVESSNEQTKGIPLVTGLQFDHVVLYEPLPVDNPEIFKSVLSITQLVNKYNLSIDRIYFGSDNTLTLYFDEVRVALGNATDLDEKLMKLQYMLPELQGKSGVLRMENYTEETKNISFETDQESAG